MNDVIKLLQNNPYPGRGIVVGCSEDGSHIITVYFIMGRSENSRNRIFEKTSDGIRAKAYDASKLTDPSLIIYKPVRVIDKYVVITNGDQTDTIYDFLANGADFHTALLTREFEPDAPNYTPRISCLISQDGSYVLSILKTADGTEKCCLRNFFEYSNPIPGLGHFISTYDSDGDPLPSFTGEPIPISIDFSKGLDYFTNKIWNALNFNNKVSIYARKTNMHTGQFNEIIINKHEEFMRTR